MGDFEDIKFQESRVMESWGIFKNTGDIYDAMEMISDFETLDMLVIDVAIKERRRQRELE